MSNRITPPNRIKIVDKDGNGTLRLARFFELISDLLWDKQYVSGTNTGFDITGPTGFTLVRGVAVPYQTDGGACRIKGNIDYTHNSLTSVNITIAGITFKTGAKQAILGHDGAGTASTRAYTVAAGSIINVTHSAASTSTQLSIDVELDEKPTWAI